MIRISLLLRKSMFSSSFEVMFFLTFSYKFTQCLKVKKGQVCKKFTCIMMDCLNEKELLLDRLAPFMIFNLPLEYAPMK
jgi:hypothetical protein